MPRPVSDIREKIFTSKIGPYWDVIIFVVTLLAANWLWKGTVRGDEPIAGYVTWFGMDVTNIFDWWSDHIAKVVYTMLYAVTDGVRLVNGNCIRWEEGTGTSIVWGCTGLKQAFIWLCLILTARGKWVRKTWYIPFGWICVYAFNILRIFLIALLIRNHPDWFTLLHDYLFKYLFYGMLFMLWVWWTDKVGQKDNYHKVQSPLPEQKEVQD